MMFNGVIGMDGLEFGSNIYTGLYHIFINLTVDFVNGYLHLVFLNRIRAGKSAKCRGLEGGIDGPACFYSQFTGRVRNDLRDQFSVSAVQFYSQFRAAFKQADNGALQEIAGTDGFGMIFEQDDILGGKLEQAAGRVPVA